MNSLPHYIGRAIGFAVIAVMVLALAISVFLFALMAIHSAHERDWWAAAWCAGLAIVYGAVGIGLAGERR